MSARLYRRIFVIFCVLLIVTAACSMPLISRATPTMAVTEAVQATMDALMTQASGGVITATPGAGATSTTAPSPTSQVATLLPSSTPMPTATQVFLPTSTNTPVCDQAAFISDVSVPDGSVIPAGTTFIKTWRLKNIGSCTWTPEYAVVFDTGDAMGGPSSQKLGVSVPPGQLVDIPVSLKAPGQPGHFRGYWKLRNAAGTLFGLGPEGDRFFVDIKVVSSPAAGTGYDFSANVCLAQWTGNGKSLPCIGKDGSADGFVLYQSRPVLESGYVDDEPGLLTNPPLVTDGVIRGKYPAYTVKTNDHFLSIVNCENNAKKCNVRFQLDYQIDNGAIQTLGSWNEAYEGQFTVVDVNLSSLAGKNVNFILTVFASGASDQDRALWLLPRIVVPQPTATPTNTPKPSITPTATATATATATIPVQLTPPTYP